MGLFVNPGPPTYNWMVENPAEGTQPTNAGVTITPSGSANTYTSYTEIMPNIAEEGWLLSLWFHSVGGSAIDRRMVATIGIDYAGGTTYTDLEINHLIVSRACVGNRRPGVHYAFPIHIPVGSAIACKVSQGGTNTAAVRCMPRVYGQPAYPESTWKGSRVETLGSVSVSTYGTSVTPGGASEGSWTTIGTTADNNNKWWQVGVGVPGDTSQTNVFNNIQLVEIGRGGAGVEQTLIPQQWVQHDGSEATTNIPFLGWNFASTPVPSGTTIRARVQADDTTASQDPTIAVYAVS